MYYPSVVAIIDILMTALSSAAIVIWEGVSINHSASNPTPPASAAYPLLVIVLIKFPVLGLYSCVPE
jgi:hypothetical protein